MPEDRSLVEHLTIDLVAAYLDGDVGDEERAGVESHLASCDECRREIVEVSRALKAERRLKPWYLAGPVAAAAAVAAIMFLRPQALESPTEAVLRGTDSMTPLATTLGIEVVAPLDGSTLARDDVVFMWHSAALDASYRLTVTRRDGHVAWSATLSDTTAEVPTSEVLQPGQSYMWYVDALLPDGQSTTTGVKIFSTLPQ